MKITNYPDKEARPQKLWWDGSLYLMTPLQVRTYITCKLYVNSSSTALHLMLGRKYPCPVQFYWEQIGHHYTGLFVIHSSLFVTKLVHMTQVFSLLLQDLSSKALRVWDVCFVKCRGFYVCPEMNLESDHIYCIIRHFFKGNLYVWKYPLCMSSTNKRLSLHGNMQLLWRNSKQWHQKQSVVKRYTNH